MPQWQQGQRQAAGHHRQQVLLLLVASVGAAGCQHLAGAVLLNRQQQAQAQARVGVGAAGCLRQAGDGRCRALAARCRHRAVKRVEGRCLVQAEHCRHRVPAVAAAAVGAVRSLHRRRQAEGPVAAVHYQSLARASPHLEALHALAGLPANFRGLRLLLCLLLRRLHPHPHPRPLPRPFPPLHLGAVLPNPTLRRRQPSLNHSLPY